MANLTIHVLVNGEQPISVKSIRPQYTMKKQRVALYAQHHEVPSTERKFGIARKNIQWWLKNFCDSDFEQSKWRPGAEIIFEGRLY